MVWVMTNPGLTTRSADSLVEDQPKALRIDLLAEAVAEVRDDAVVRSEEYLQATRVAADGE